ncbi:heterokaryon incompatibility Het-C, partial [Nadsonia fulvescens var. elongata DSM 6958]
MSTRSTGTFPVVLCVSILFLCFAKGTHAFGAGNIPSLSTLEGKNFRHGDIEDTLANIIYTASGGIFSKLKGGKKFDKYSIKRTYFGNWLRDYSQAVDVGTLSKGIKLDTIRILLWVMAFMEFGYATNEFEVTNERIGCYRPEEHIDNPKGYAEGDDARKYDSRLRGPVQPIELEIDPQTGMKNYICNERGNWSTSSRFVRESLEKAIHHGRIGRHQNSDNDEYEALRLLGQALHTLEDFPSHSNYTELCLIEMGQRNVFPHVGSNTMINLNGKRVWPLITGTFGGMDFVHSLLGEAQDSLSQIEVEEMDNQLTESVQSQASDTLKSHLSKLPFRFDLPSVPVSNGTSFSNFSSKFGSRDMDDSSFDGLQKLSIEDYMNRLESDSNNIRASDSGANLSTDEVIQKLYPIFVFRDRVARGLSMFFDKIPGLNLLMDKISGTVTLFVMSLIEPIIKPIIKTVVSSIHTGSSLAVSQADQYEVWNNANSTNPTHSQLSKDHFSLYLNECAGLVAVATLDHVVPLVVQAWDDTSINPQQVINEILSVFHHPALASTPLQHKMKQVVSTWYNDLGSKTQTVINGLSSDGVKNGANHKPGSKVPTHTGKCNHGSSNSNIGSNIYSKLSAFDNSNNCNSGSNNGSNSSYYRRD